MVALTRIKFSISQLHDNRHSGMPRCQGLVFSMSIMCRTHVLPTNMKGLIDTSLIYYLCCGALQLRICVSKKCLQIICANKESANSSGLSYFFGLSELRAVRLQWTIKSIVGLSTGPAPSKINVITDMGSFKVY